MNGWVLDETTTINKKISDILHTAAECFDAQMRHALLKTEYDALLKEIKYNDMFQQDMVGSDWLKHKSMSKVMELLNRYQMMAEKGAKPGFWFRLKWSFIFGIKMLSFLNGKSSDVIAALEKTYYLTRKIEIEQELDSIALTLQSVNITQSLKDLRSFSLQILRNKIAKKYASGERRVYTLNEIKPKTANFLNDYPVVLSTTYSAKNCISKDMVFDYVIMDEASQVDIKTGALALSCAMNAVIVGDNKQLPNVVSRDEAIALKAIQTMYKVENKIGRAHV